MIVSSSSSSSFSFLFFSSLHSSFSKYSAEEIGVDGRHELQKPESSASAAKSPPISALVNECYAGTIV